MACDPLQLVQDARCIQVCVPQYMMQAASLAALCRVSLSPVTPVCNGTVVDFLQRMEVGTNGATPSVANLNSGTYGLAAGTWTKVGADGFWARDSAVNLSVPGLKLADGSGCGDAIGGVSSMNLAAIPGDRYALMTWAAAKAVITGGFAFRLNSSVAVDVGDIRNLFRFQTAGGNFFSVTMEIEGTDNKFMIYAHGGGLDGAHVINSLDAGTTYWATFRLDATANAPLRIYRLSDLALQGAESIADRGGTDACTAMRCFGLTDTTGQQATGASILQMSDIACAFSDVYPLLPII